MVRSVLNLSAARRCAGLLPLVVTAAVTQGLGACGKKASDEATSTATPYSGIAIAAVAPDYSSSKLYFQSLKDGLPTGDIKTLLTGESGDPLPITLDNKLYFFNRVATSSNFRTLDPKQADGAPTTQIKTEKAGVGDPQDGLMLSGNRLLLAHLAGKLVVVNPTDGSVKQEITADWDLGSDAADLLRPVAFYVQANSVSREIYVLHQGQKADFSGYNNSQQLFILKDDGSQLTAVDVDSTKAKIQGIKLNVFNPQIIVGTTDPTKPIVAGFCTVFDTVSPCTSGFERVDLANRSSTLIFDRSTATEKGNGNVVGAKSGKFYAAVAASDGAGGYKSQIQVFDPTAATAKTFYELTDTNYAAYALGYDLSANRLYVGEKKSDQTGQFAIFDLSTESSTPTNLALPLPPYKVAFVP